MDMNELAGLFGEEEKYQGNDIALNTIIDVTPDELLDELADAFGDDPQPTTAKPSDPMSITHYLNSRGYHLHECHPIGHHIYPRGCVRIMYRDDIIRYADFDQLDEMEAARQRGFTDEVLAQVEGIGCPGPVRVGKPPIDAKGNPIVESNKGDYGSLTAECKWIEEHDNVFVAYMGTDENWPDGCYAIESGKAEPDYYDPEQIRYIARDLMGMPHIKRVKGNGKGGKDTLEFVPGQPQIEAADFEDDPPKFETVNVVAGLNDAVWGTMSQAEWDKLFE